MHQTSHHHHFQVSAASLAGHICKGAWHAAGWVGKALRVQAERRKLMMLDDEALKDFGLSRADAFREGTRGFWDLPE